MIHAYLAILTGSDGDEDEFEEGFDGSHGRHFQRCFYAVDRMTRELLGIAVSDDSTQKTSQGLLRKPFDAKNYVVAPRRTSRLSWLVSKGRPQRKGSECEQSDGGDSEPERSVWGDSDTEVSEIDDSQTRRESLASSSGRSR